MRGAVEEGPFHPVFTIIFVHVRIEEVLSSLVEFFPKTQTLEGRTGKGSIHIFTTFTPMASTNESSLSE